MTAATNACIPLSLKREAWLAHSVVHEIVCGDQSAEDLLVAVFNGVV
jgi:hypothetical protein